MSYWQITEPNCERCGERTLDDAQRMEHEPILCPDCVNDIYDPLA